MLKSLFIWLDHTPLFYWAMALSSAVLLIIWVVNGWRHKEAGELRFTAALLFLFVLLSGRWPFLFSATEYNPDESQILAGAITLAHDPVFWRSVEGTTSGPLNFYALLPIHWLGAPIDFFTARVLGLALIWAAMLACYGALKMKYGTLAARLGILPALTFFSLVHEWDFIHYSSEHVSLFLFSGAVYYLLRGSASPKLGRAHLFWGGLLAGLMPWAKLQAGPLGFAVIGWGFWRCLTSASTDKTRNVGMLIVGAIMPTIFFLGGIILSGETDTFLRNYIVQNIHYVSVGSSWRSELAGLSDRAAETHLLPLFLLSQGMSLCLGSVWLIWRRIAPDVFWTGAALFSILAAICVLVPGRGFLHYSLLLVMPLALWGGASIGIIFGDNRASHWRKFIGALLIFFSAVLPWCFRLQQPRPDMIGRLAADWRVPRSDLGNVLKICSRPDDCLAIWGWFPRLHVESALPQATRTGYTYWAIMPSPMRDYHRRTFLQDLIKKRPTFFVDAVGANSYFFRDRATQGHEVFPDLGNYIRENYVLVIDFGYARLYARDDQIGRTSFALSSLQRAVAAGRSDNIPADTPREIPEVSGLSHKTIAGQNVTMLLPPAEVIWALDGMEREFTFEYGYDPVAYRETSQGNGTELTVSLHGPDRKPEILFQRLLDPAHVPADRGVQTAHVALPALSAGESLSVRTSPGPYNDNSWDWAYITRTRFRYYPYYALGNQVSK